MWSQVTTLMDMRTVGVRELKAQLSRVLRDVQRGEAILITDRGTVIAELRRPDGGGWQETASRAERVLGRLAAEGRVRLAEPVVNPYPASPLRLADGAARELLAQDRDES
jgi:antitoxin (DNA-binding transcriptional repressor) of toxin-antitoxin stability system